MDNNLETNNLQDDADTIDLEGYIDRCLQTMSKNFILVILIIALTAEIIVIVKGLLYTPIYQGYVTYLVEKTQDSTIDTDIVNSLGASLQEAFDSGGLHDMIDGEYTEKPEWLNSSMIIPEYDEYTNILTINVKTDNYYRTKSLLEAVKRVYPQYASSLYGAVFFSEINEKEVSPELEEPYKIWKHLIIGVLVGILVSLIWTIIYSYIHKTITDADHMEKICNMTCLEELPKVIFRKNDNQDFYTDTTRRNIYRQALRSLRHKVDRTMEKSGEQVLMVTSSVAGEGKSFTAAELALAMARSGKSVILVETNFFHPTLAKMLKLEKEGDLGDYLKHEKSLDDIIIKDGDFHTIVVGQGGFPDMNEDCVTKFRDMIRELRGSYNRVIIDAPSVMNFSYINIIQECADALLFVVCYNYAPAYQIENAISSLKGEDVHILGYVFNGVDHIMKAYGAYGYYRYGYQKYGYGSYGEDK